MKTANKLVQGLKPFLLMVMVQITYASVNVLYKLAINDGMSVRVITAYRLILALLFTSSLALVFERKSRPKLTWRVLFMAFCSGLFGASLFHNLFLEALDLVSATFATAVYNLVPAVTFMLAIFCGLEKLNMRTSGGKAKVLGTIVGIGGSMLLTFFKGPEIKVMTFRTNLLHQNGHQAATMHTHSSSHKFLGVLCGFASCFSFALWLIIQGTVASGVVVIAITWCVQKRGPMFVSVFNPLMLVLVAVADSFMLNENLYVGSIMGGALIVCGLYMVLWGKSREMNTTNHLESSEVITQENEAKEIVVVSDISQGNIKPTPIVKAI